MNATRLPRVVTAWGWVSLLADLGHETISALLPAFLVGLGAPPLALGAIEGVADGAAAVTKLLGGRLADRLARLKPPAILGYLATAIALPAIALAGSWSTVLLLRSTAWLGRGLRGPLRDTLLDAAIAPQQRGRAFGVERAMDQVGAVLAPLTVGLLLQLSFGVRTIMALGLIPGLAAALIVAIAIRERPPTPSSERAAHAQRTDAAATATAQGAAPDPRASGGLRRMLVALGVFGSGDFAKSLLVLWALGPTVGALRPGAITTAVLLYAGFNGMTVVAAWLGGRLSDHVGRKPVLLFAYGTGCLGALVPAVFTPSVAAAACALALAGLLVGTEEAVERAWAADLTPPSRRGWGFGVVHTTNGVGDLVASALVGGLWTLWGARIAFASAALLMAVGTGLMARVPAPPRRQAA